MHEEVVQYSDGHSRLWTKKDLKYNKLREWRLGRSLAGVAKASASKSGAS